MSFTAADPLQDQSHKPFVPPVPESMEELGLPASFLDQLALKHLYFKTELTGRGLSQALGLNFSLIEPMLDTMKRQHLIAVKSSLGMGNISALFTLTESGRTLAKEHLEANSYTGLTPVPLEQYTIGVRMQSLREGWLTEEAIRKAFRHMTVSDRIISMVGPSINAGKTLLLYGQPGNGKTYMAEALFHLESDPVFVPFAIECQGQIIQVFDPVYHRAVDEPEPEETIWAVERKPRDHDGRWIRSKRPFIMTGGELTLEMLDLFLNPASGVYDAPFHVKANNGIYLIDDFGRQKVTPTEVLNRWIVPMERRVDYLQLRSGAKATMPFETFLVFSTNLRPNQLGDEAFLRRIQYKIFLRSPDEAEFLEIFDKVCQQEQINAPRAVVEEFLERHYRGKHKPMRRCHPRDVVQHALDLIRFERLPWQLTPEVLDRAFESTFVDDLYED